MIIIIIVSLFIISFFLSIISLRGELKKNVKVKEVSNELSKGRVIFHAQSEQAEEMH